MTFIDSNGARLLGIERILANENTVQSIDEILFQEINLHELTNLFTDGRKSNELRSKPFCYYTMIFKVNDLSYYIIGIKSNGEIRTMDKVDDTQFGFSNDNKLDK